MSEEKHILPAGRIVWGHPLKGQDKTNYTTKQPVLDDNGNKITEYAFGVAYSKEVFNAQIWPLMYQEAAKLYPSGQPPGFSWKFTDGDSVDKKGKPYSEREGYAGSVILTVRTEAFRPECWRWEQSLNNGKGDYVPVAETEIKTGDYVSVNVNFKAHSNNSGGIYVNPNAIELVGYGTEIVSSTSNPNELFGGVRHELPAGASATPMSSAPAEAQAGLAPTAAPMVAPAAAPMVAPAAAPMVAPAAAPMVAPAAAPVVAPAAAPMVAPAADFVDNALGNPAAPMAAPSQPPAMSATTSPTNAMPGMPPAR